MKGLTIVYLFYMFVALYLFFFFIFIYFRNRREMYNYPLPRKNYSVSVVIPAYNEQDTIADTVKAVLNSDYKNVVEIIVVNDGSSDGTAKIVRELQKYGKYKKLKLLDKKNTGKADSLNCGLRVAKGELFAVVDSDSYPEKDAIGKLVGFFNDEKTAAVTSEVLVKNPKYFIEKLQALEYITIGWTRKLLDFIEGVYVTPGPLSVYRKAVLVKIGGFDKKNLTEDIEITWKIVHNGYRARSCLGARVYTVAPSRWKQWYSQRIRWNIGGLQTMNKYKRDFAKKGMLGLFILPFFAISATIGLVGLAIMFYLIAKRALSAWLSTSYSISAQTAVLSMQDINLNATVLNMFGLFLFLLSFLFIMLALGIMRQKELRNQNIFNLLFYLVVYMTVYPAVMFITILRLIRGKKQW